MLARIILLLAIGLLARAEDTPDAKTLLTQSRDALHAFQSYMIEQQVVVEMKSAASTRVEMPVKLAVSNPGKVRIESSGQLGDMLIVSDGRNTWTYAGPLKQYTKTAAASSPDALMRSLGGGMGQTIGSAAKDPYLTAKVTGEEPVEIEGKPIDCYVVEAMLDTIEMPARLVLSEGTQKLWIDKKSKVAVKLTTTARMSGGPLPGFVEMNQRVTVASLKVNEPVPDSVFVFTPPAGAREVAEFSGPVRITPDPTGKPAADFTVKSIEGKEYTLQALHGKVALLDFVTSWCLPCKDDLAVLEKAHQEFGDGIVMIGIDVGEDQATADKFVHESKPAFPVALASGTNLVRDYGISAYPTLVLIDRDGKIALYHVGAGGDKELREALAKVGQTGASQAAH